MRELRNVVERAVYRAAAAEPALAAPIDAVAIDPFESPWRPRTAVAAQAGGRAALARAAPPPPRVDRPFAEQTRDFEIAILRGALAAEEGRQARAAERLGLTYHQLRGLLRKHGLGSERARRRARRAEAAPTPA